MFLLIIHLLSCHGGGVPSPLKVGHHIAILYNMFLLAKTLNIHKIFNNIKTAHVWRFRASKYLNK